MGAVAEDTQGVHICLLGPFELSVNGSNVEVPRTRVRDLLTLLAVRTPAIVSFESLIDDLWGSEPPKNPRAALRVVVSRARQVLNPNSDALATTPAGLRLHASTDMQQFLGVSLDSPTPTELVAALALWRGEPHVSLLPSVSWQAQTQRLAERRRELLLRLSDALIVEGKASEATRLLETAVDESPGSEALTTRLAAAYAAGGRKSAALRVLEQTRLLLRDEFGISPGSEFEQLERNILNDAVEVFATLPKPEPSSKGRFVGRLEEIELLTRNIDGHTLLIGEPGIGKSRLLGETTRLAQTQGYRVIAARCAEAPERTMQALADILAQLVEGVGELPIDTARALRRVNKGLVEEPLNALSAPISREGLVRILAEFIDDRLRTMQGLLIVDDLHWIDRSSFDVLLDLLSRERQCIVLATRSTPLLDRVIRSSPGIRQVELSGLQGAHSRALITETLGVKVAPEIIESIHEQSGGNPFFVELLATLVAEGALIRGDALPVTALVAVQSRIERLGRASQQTLLAASVLGQDIDLEILTAVRPSAERDLAEAIDEGLLRLTDDGRSASFVHALVSEGAYELLPDGYRSDLHDQVAVALENREGREIEFARHAARAESHDPYRCVNAHIGAGRAYLRSLSSKPALDMARSARQVTQRWDIREPRLLAELSLLEGEALRWTDGPASAAALLNAASIARAHDAVDLVIESTVALCRRGRNTFAGAVDDQAAGAVDNALSLPAVTDAQRARLLAGSSLLFAASTADVELRQRFSQALEIAHEIGDEQLEAEILLEADFGLSHPDDFGARQRAAARLSELSGADHDLRWETAWLDFGIAVQLADADRAIRACGQMRTEVALVSARRRDFGMSIVEAVVSQVADETENAERWANVAVEIGLEQFPESWVMSAYGAILLGIRRQEGRMGELVTVFESLLADNPQFPTWHVGVAITALKAGEMDRAAAHFDLLAADRFTALVKDGSWTAAIGALCETAAVLGRRDEAATLYELLSPFAGRILWSGTSPFGPADAGLAMAAETAGRSVDADAHRRAAAKTLERLRPLGELSQPAPTQR